MHNNYWSGAISCSHDYSYNYSDYVIITRIYDIYNLNCLFHVPLLCTLYEPIFCILHILSKPHPLPHHYK